MSLRAVFDQDPELRKECQRTLGGGGPGISARWWKVSVELSRQPKYNKAISLTWIQSIEDAGNNGPERANLCLNALADTIGCNTADFRTALKGALLEVTADLFDKYCN